MQTMKIEWKKIIEEERKTESPDSNHWVKMEDLFHIRAFAHVDDV